MPVSIGRMRWGSGAGYRSPLPGDTLPAAEAIINPNLRDCEFPSKSLAGVGVAFYLMLALRCVKKAGLKPAVLRCRTWQNISTWWRWAPWRTLCRSIPITAF
jgi:single-stranded-DNA-specific exonuclease